MSPPLHRAREVVCLLGLPGSGKSTVAGAVGAHRAAQVVSVGAMLQERARRGDDAAATLLNSGRGVSTAEFSQIMCQALVDAPRTVLDGSPRESHQVPPLLDVSERVGASVVGLLVVVPEHLARERLISRGAIEAGRADNHGDVLLRRLRVQADQLDELVSEFERRWPLIRLDGEPDAAVVCEAAVNAINATLG